MAVDLFDKPNTLKKIWSRLVTGYAVDAAAQAKKEGEEDKPFTAKDCEFERTINLLRLYMR